MKRFVPVMALAVLTMARAAVADHVDLVLNAANGDAVTVTTTANNNEGTVAGPYAYSISSSSNTNLIPNGDYEGFCIALTTTIGYGLPAHTFDVQGMNDFTLGNGKSIIQLFNDFIAAGGDTIHPAHHNTVSDALTVAIWDVLNATSSSLKIGTFGNISLDWGSGVDPSPATDAQILASDNTGWAVWLANKWLHDLNSSFTDPGSLLSNGDVAYALVNQTTQSQSIVIGISNNPHFVVPEPTPLLSLISLGTFGMVLGGVGLLWYRRRATELGPCAAASTQSTFG